MATADRWIAIKGLDRELRAPHLVDGSLVLLALLLCGGFASAPFDLAIFVPAGKDNPGDVDGDDEQYGAAIDGWVFPDRFFVWRRSRVHERLLRFGRRIHGAAGIAPSD